MKTQLIVFLILTALPNQAGCQARPATSDAPTVTAAAPPPASAAAPAPATAPAPAATTPAPAAVPPAPAKKTAPVSLAAKAASPERKEPRRAGGGGSRVAMVQRPAAAAPSRGGGDWPQWRGPERTGVSRETGLLKRWPADGPRLLWKAEGLGGGHSTPSIAQ